MKSFVLMVFFIGAISGYSTGFIVSLNRNKIEKVLSRSKRICLGRTTKDRVCYQIIKIDEE